MEGWQKDHIRKNLPALIQYTICSSSLLASLYADGIVSDEEIQIIDALSTQQAQSKRLYEILQTRRNCYNLLKQALKDTSQTGALSILDQCDQRNDPIMHENCGSFTRFREILLRGENQQITSESAKKFWNIDKNRLRIAIKRGDVQAIITQINLGADINTRYINSETPIIMASSLQSDANTTVKIVQYLIDSGAHVRDTDWKGHTFLHKLSLAESTLTPPEFHYMALYLVEKDLSTLFNVQDIVHGQTPLMLAVANVKVGPATLSLLYQNDVNFSLPDKNGKQLLFYGEDGRDNQLQILSLLHLEKLEDAIIAKNEKLVMLLVELGADVNGNLNSNVLETPLFHASISSDKGFAFKIIQLLIHKNADITGKDTDGQIFLHTFFLNATTFSPGFHAFAQYLVDKNLSTLFNIQDTTFGTTPLMLAARNVELNMAAITLLRENGLELTLCDNIGSSYLSYAAEGNKNRKFVAELKRNGGIKYKKLAEAIQAMDGDSVKVLVSLGADVNETNDKLETPLHLAAWLRNKTFAINIIKFIIDSGANVDAKNKDKYTFLHIFVAWYAPLNPIQFDDMANYLISKDLARLFNIPDKNLYTPFQLAVEYVEIERVTLSLLKNNGVDFNSVDSGGKSVLYYAIMFNRPLRLITDLVDIGADPRQLTTDNMSMLHIAALFGNAQLVKYFLDKGLDVNAQDIHGKTPLHYALQWPNKKNGFDTVQSLWRNGANSDIGNSKGINARDYFNMNRDLYSDADQIALCFSLGSSG